MKIQKYIPSEFLKPFIKEYIIIESADEQINRVLPGTSLAIAFRFRGQINYLTESVSNSLPASVISGLRKSPRLIHYLKDTAAIIVTFEETGAGAFFKEAIYELFSESVALDNFIKPQTIAIIEEQLSAAANHYQRIAIIEHFLRSILNFNYTDQLTTASIQKIHASKGIMEIKSLASELSISIDAFEKRFRKTVGTSPKQFSSIVRMKTMISHIHQTQTFTEAALDAGFFDQSHFNKQFKVFTGQSPAEFFRTPPLW